MTLKMLSPSNGGNTEDPTHEFTMITYLIEA